VLHSFYQSECTLYLGYFIIQLHCIKVKTLFDFSLLSKEQEAKDLSRLLELINTPASKQQLPSISWVQDENQNVTPAPWNNQGSPPKGSGNGFACHHQSTEALALEKFR
jgi:hypothetical protein